MAENPNFFVDVLCEVYLPANRDKDQDVEPSPQERARVQAAYRLPWFEQVRKLAAEKDRMVLADNKIGAVLAHSANHPGDAAWPHRAVRGVIESLGSNDVVRGLKVERYNMRRVYSKAPYESGTKERELATRYRGGANSARYLA
jgi:hypothetical protein